MSQTVVLLFSDVDEANSILLLLLLVIMISTHLLLFNSFPKLHFHSRFIYNTMLAYEPVDFSFDLFTCLQF